MTLAAKLDDLGNPAWIALTVVGFLIWWPLGLVALGYLVGSGRMARWTGCGTRRWQQNTQSDFGGWWGVRSASSGNRAFDEYRSETDYLKTYISRLRRKLGDDPDHPRYILTERGTGYRFARSPAPPAVAHP